MQEDEEVKSETVAISEASTGVDVPASALPSLHLFEKYQWDKSRRDFYYTTFLRIMEQPTKTTIIGVGNADDNGRKLVSSFYYTIGLWLQPELQDILIFFEGRTFAAGGTLVNTATTFLQRLPEGLRPFQFEDLAKYPVVESTATILPQDADKAELVARPVLPEYYESIFGQAILFYSWLFDSQQDKLRETHQIPGLAELTAKKKDWKPVQLFWPDRAWKFQWEEGFDKRFEGRQPNLYLPMRDAEIYLPGTVTEFKTHPYRLHHRKDNRV